MTRMKASVIIAVSKQGLARVLTNTLTLIYVGLLKVCVTIQMCIEVVINETGLWSSLVRRGSAPGPEGPVLEYLCDGESAVFCNL